VLGFVSAMTRDKSFAHHLVDHLPAVGEFAVAAGALLGGQLQQEVETGALAKRVRRALEPGGLRTVFQPIVMLDSGRLVGYEALTRFADRSRPDRIIAHAHGVGMGLDLEHACLTAALAAAEALPAGAWLSLNVAPSVVLGSTELPLLLAGRPRRVILEITEHAKIDDYDAVRKALARLGPAVDLAVDDAGAGFASLRHVVELQPRFLKLDVSLVRRVDRDLARQAMIAGLCHFADRAGCEVIAEGVEEPAELDMLKQLGVPLGQGFLFGQPNAVSRSRSRAAERQALSSRARSTASH
jgi:EAL domain-containing protein (putative c-di-GMP-specific phosphodiesterase class I)